MSKSRPVYCWDTSVFIAHFNAEQDKPLEDIRAVAREIETDKADLVISMTTVIELMDVMRDPQIDAQFKGVLKRPNVSLIDVNWKVAERALAARCRANDAGKNIKVADSQIIGTADLFKVDALHTFDIGLLKISATAIVSGLKICKPVLLSGQKSLPLDLKPEPLKMELVVLQPHLRKRRHVHDGSMLREIPAIELAGMGLPPWAKHSR